MLRPTLKKKIQKNGNNNGLWPSIYLIIPQVGNPQKTNSEEFEEIANR